MRQVVCIITGLFLFVNILQATQETKDSTQKVSQEVEKTIEKVLEWLCQREEKNFPLAAFGVNGYGPDDAKYGKKFREWVRQIIQRKPSMEIYPLALETIAVTQAFVLTTDGELRDKIKKWVEEAVVCILKIQEVNDLVGWTYYEGKFETYQDTKVK